MIEIQDGLSQWHYSIIVNKELNVAVQILREVLSGMHETAVTSTNQPSPVACLSQ